MDHIVFILFFISIETVLNALDIMLTIIPFLYKFHVIMIILFTAIYGHGFYHYLIFIFYVIYDIKIM
jgi:hypothetical protein